ncbi:RNA helicase [uncultured Senegalimassilia sp.]|uniref:DEAD/DEAH box helicase n=1 Tax=uncultured Senegalimassilia sp. TaxID=1714350 RepID=UPI0026719884|nr:DEAD/DEAH box helicase [uncultured Senegalimassilia sp.]
MADIHTFEGEDIVETLAAQAEGHEPGELGALAYHLYDTNPDLTEEEAFEAFTGWVADRGIELWPHQEEALMSLMVGDHVILGTPTGSGKSLVALGMHFMAMCFGETSYYTAPIKALVSEKFFSLVELLGRDNVGMITGDVHINTDAPIICCTEEILANQALREGPDALIHSVAMDEFHFFSDTDRGWAWQVPLLTLPKTQFLLMSATLGDVTQIADLLRRQTTRDVSNVIDAPRPVPLSYEYALTPLEGTVELALRKNEGPLYIVHFSQDAALTSAQNLASYGVATKEQREAVKEAMKGAQFSTAFGKTLKRLLGCGVGVHHAGMLPRYRLLVEKLAQQGLLPVICGTDTLGVGINVPIHTVVLTQLTKFDGRKMRRLRSREFHQIAGRAGRSGFDTEGVAIAEAPEHEIENHKAEVKAAGDPKKLKKIKKKRPPENFVNWNEDTFKKLVDSVPEQLTPRMRITHSMVLAEVEQGGNARARVDQLIDDSLQPDEEKVKLHVRAAEVLQTLIDAGVVVHDVDENGQDAYSVTMDLPEDFALDQPLSPFLLAALELLDPESPEYAFDLVSMVEATLEDPRQVLRAQERKARDAAMAEMKMDGVDYDERLERIAEVTYPKPLEDLLDAAFGKYCDAVPWARDYCLRPKSVLRDMLESAADFKGYIQKLGIMRYEGILLRYLSEAFRGLDRTIPEDKRTEQLKDIIAWLGLVVRSVDSSLVDEWENAGSVLDAAPPDAAGAEAVVHDRRGLTVLVRNALFSRVRMAAHRDIVGLGEADGEWSFGERAWAQALDEYYEAHEEILLDADARSKAYLILNEADEEEAHVWHVRQIFHDEDGDNDFAIAADVDLDATQAGDGVVFKDYRVGFAEDLLGEW